MNKKIGRPKSDKPLGRMVWIPGKHIVEVTNLIKEPDVISELLNSQTSLGAECDAILMGNLDSLYEEDC
jgi:hypothetical protein